MTSNEASDAHGASAPSSEALQHASNLLALLHDEQIWNRMLRAGFPDGWRNELTCALGSARADYRRSSDARSTQGAGVVEDQATDVTTPLAPHSTDATLRAVVDRICAAGRETFSETESLTRRFASTLANHK